jgi:hypothetical protein
MKVAIDLASQLAPYAAPGIFTTLDALDREVSGLPADVRSIVAFVQQVLVHEAFADLYGTSFSAAQLEGKQIHDASRTLAHARALAPTPLRERPPAQRSVCVCRHFATLCVAVMRGKGIPSRARCGFANYFLPGKHVDHWVAEYWHAGEGRWHLVDSQVDDLQRKYFGIDFDTLDVPRDRFLVAGDAWHACRRGADPMSFGIAGTPMWGLVEVYGDLFQDLAALQKVELLPWGWYGLAKDKEGIKETVLIDHLADISSKADAAALASLHELLKHDARLRVPDDMLASIVAKERSQPMPLPSGLNA